MLLFIKHILYLSLVYISSSTLQRPVEHMTLGSVAS